jgi:hypothetical protein
MSVEGTTLDWLIKLGCGDNSYCNSLYQCAQGKVVGLPVRLVELHFVNFKQKLTMPNNVGELGSGMIKETIGK